jgi:cytochrome c1
MIKQLTHTARAAFIALASLMTTSAFAAGGACLPYGEAQTTPTEIASLRNGAKLYFNYCASCHSLQYMRYKRLASDSRGLPRVISSSTTCLRAVAATLPAPMNGLAKCRRIYRSLHVRAVWIGSTTT